MQYTKNNTIYNIFEIRTAHPNMSIPDGAGLSDIGYYQIESVNPPTPGENEIAVPGEPEEYAPNQWRETWVIQPAPPPPVPQTVSRFQARAALHLAGLLEQVETLMQSPDTPMLARLAWQDAQVFERQSPTVLTLAAALNLTDADLDQLFIDASGITA